MTRTKKTIKAKEAIKLRSKKLANGNASLYLDYYHKGKREYEFLSLYIVPEQGPGDREKNRHTLEVANAIKAQRLLDITNEKGGLQTTRAKALPLASWLMQYKAEKREQGKTWLKIVQSTILAVEAYDGANKTTLTEIDKAWCAGFVDYLQRVFRKRDGKPLAPTTVKNYQDMLSIALNKAVKRGLMQVNPFSLLEAEEKAPSVNTPRDYLTIEEVKRLIETPCGHETIKQAFLFSCFCGLRVSDVKALKWGDMYVDNGQTVARVKQVKTDELVYLPLSAEALKWLPVRAGAPDCDNVFPLPSAMTISRHLKTWGAEAGISKRMHFHASRHTFATMMLTLGADLYTTSKLMGHTKVETTQVYAKIVNAKKAEAVNLVNGIF